MNEIRKIGELNFQAVLSYFLENAIYVVLNIIT